MSKIKVGDVVTLNSGGPRMTVNAVADPGYDGTVMVHVDWINNDKTEHDRFPEQCLTVWVPKKENRA